MGKGRRAITRLLLPLRLSSMVRVSATGSLGWLL